ncbi:hypothetical protein [Pseudomonas sp. M47T1]|uniref:hypothetical protein n=1 Tax=Pseudomonas sp. M47T1 TaxID=1179778 RepID=UPI001EE6862B|nr:hypothetical protein [Pseudomonas sp. M47T1]
MGRLQSTATTRLTIGRIVSVIHRPDHGVADIENGHAQTAEGFDAPHSLEDVGFVAGITR